MSISPINSPEHQKHADGLTDALRQKATVERFDPDPKIRRTSLESIRSVDGYEVPEDFFTPDMPDGWDSEGGSLD